MVLASGLRQLPGFQGKAIRALTVALGIYVVAYIADLPFYLGIPIFGHHRPLVYGVALFLAFVLVPAARHQPGHRLPWYDLLAAVAALTACWYLAARWNTLVFGTTAVGPAEKVGAAIVVAASLEAARRSLGWIFAALGLFFVVYPLYGSWFPGLLFTKSYSFARLAGAFYASETGIFGLAMNLFTTIVAIFFLFGALMGGSKSSDLLMGLGMAVAGRLRGGAAKTSVISSALFGTISGVGAANVVATGTFTIPLMKKEGFPPHVAGAVEAVASSGGTLMPPVMGAAAFIMADLLGLPYWSIVVAAFLPSVLYYLALFLMVDSHAAVLGIAPGGARLTTPLRQLLRTRGHFALPILVLVLLMGYVGYTAQTAAFWSGLVLVAVSWLRRETRIGWKASVAALEQGTLGFVQLAPAAGVIGILMASVEMTGLGLTLASGLVEAAGGKLLLLLIFVAVAAIVMGMAASPLMVYILLAVLLVPAMVELGVTPMAAHMFLLYYSVASLITPPVALSAMTAAGLAGADFWKTGLESCRLAIVAFVVPFLFVYEPALLLSGSAAQLLVAVPTAIAGTVALSGGVSGYLLWGRSAPWARVLLIAGGLAMIFPGWATDLAGGVLTLPAVAQVWRSRRRQSAHRMKAALDS